MASPERTRGRGQSVHSKPIDALAAVLRRAPQLRGKRGIGWHLMRRSERRGELEGTWRLRMKDGTRLELPRQSRMTWAVAFEGRYDEATIRRTAEFITPKTIALDVGASIGLWTVQIARIAAARGSRVWTFEPNPANTAWIRRNVELNGLDDSVTVCEIGLGDTAESSFLVSAEYGVGNGAIVLAGRSGIHRKNPTKHPRVPITLARLDDIDLPARVSFIKLDVEGYEAAFLRGAGGLIERDRPVIFGEFASGWLERRGEDLRAALGGLDYDVETLTHTRPRPWRPPSAVELLPVDLESAAPLPQNLLLRPR